MQQHHKPLKLKRKLTLQFEKELFNGYRIHAYDTDEIVLAIPRMQPPTRDESLPDNFYRTSDSFIITRNDLLKDWPLRDISQLAERHLDSIMDLEPELVLIGTGRKQSFPETQLLSRFYSQGIGVEVMDSSAACRTFNILAGEGRKVVAGIIID